MGEEKSKNIGDFTFDNYKEKNYDKNKETAIELMCRHFEFYEQLKSPNIEYATMGAKLSCTHGNKYIYLNAVKDHGVYDGENPVLTCKDCKVKENICDFGACGNGKFEPLYSEEAPHPAETALNQKGQKRYVCRPILLGEWGHGDINSRSLLIGEVYIDKEYKVYKEESANDGKPSEFILHCINTIESQNKTKNPIDAMQNREEVFGEYVEALMTCDNLLCLYGGVITIVENSEPKEEMITEEIPEPEEEQIILVSIWNEDEIVLLEKYPELVYENWPPEKKMCAEKLWKIFYENGEYDACFVSGVIGNVFGEGEFGILQGGCDWELYNKGGTTLKGKEKIKNIAEANAACNTPKDFGVGMLQWSYPARKKLLLACYEKTLLNDSQDLSTEQLMEAECQMIKLELEGKDGKNDKLDNLLYNDYRHIYQDYELITDNSEDLGDAITLSTSQLFRDYLRPETFTDVNKQDYSVKSEVWQQAMNAKEYKEIPSICRRIIAAKSFYEEFGGNNE